MAVFYAQEGPDMDLAWVNWGNFSPEEAITEFIANALDACGGRNDGFSTSFSPQANKIGSITICNNGPSVEKRHFLTGKSRSGSETKKEHGGYGLGMKEAAACLVNHSDFLSLTIDSGDCRFSMCLRPNKHVKEEKTLHVVFSPRAAPCNFETVLELKMGNLEKMRSYYEKASANFLNLPIPRYSKLANLGEVLHPSSSMKATIDVYPNDNKNEPLNKIYINNRLIKSTGEKFFFLYNFQCKGGVLDFVSRDHTLKSTEHIYSMLKQAYKAHKNPLDSPTICDLSDAFQTAIVSADLRSLLFTQTELRFKEIFKPLGLQDLRKSCLKYDSKLDTVAKPSISHASALVSRSKHAYSKTHNKTLPSFPVLSTAAAQSTAQTLSCTPMSAKEAFDKVLQNIMPTLFCKPPDPVLAVPPVPAAPVIPSYENIILFHPSHSLYSLAQLCDAASRNARKNNLLERAAEMVDNALRVG